MGQFKAVVQDTTCSSMRPISCCFGCKQAKRCPELVPGCVRWDSSAYTLVEVERQRAEALHAAEAARQQARCLGTVSLILLTLAIFLGGCVGILVFHEKLVAQLAPVSSVLGGAVAASDANVATSPRSQLVPLSSVVGRATDMAPDVLVASPRPQLIANTSVFAVSEAPQIEPDSTSVDGGTFAARDRAAAKLAHDAQVQRSKSLTVQYLKWRAANDFAKLQLFFTKTTRMHIDLSGAGMLLTIIVHMRTRTDLTGPDAVTGFYKAFPVEAGDVMPSLEDIKCTSSTCTMSSTVSRPVLGRVKDVGVLHWSATEDKLERLDLRLSNA